jgi:hypothetical protein
MDLPPDYYHCFLGNGLDAVLIGPTGSMVPDKVVVDRCYWYKSDRYYPEDKLVKVAGRFPIDRPLIHAQGSGWYEIAPLGRTWYELFHQGQRLKLQTSEQRFVPQEGSLYSGVDYGLVKGEVVTWLHATHSLLVERFSFSQEVEFQAWMGPGVWWEEGWDTDPFYALSMSDSSPHGRYDLGETKGVMSLALEPIPTGFGVDGNDRMISARGRIFSVYYSIVDDRQGVLNTSWLEEWAALGYAALREAHLSFWENFFSVSQIQIPDEQFQYFYESSMHLFKSMQNRDTGGIPVNNLRRTWSSHVFWDSFFSQRALLEANHQHEALEGCRFFQRTLAHARRHAQEEFGCEGLKWDWEITHDGRKAYGTLLHQKYQVHNNASYANEIWGHYEFTRDLGMLREFYPILEGLARFFLDCIVEEDQGRYEVGYWVGVHESPVKVRNDGINLAGAIAIFHHASVAAQILGVQNEFSQRCAHIAEELKKTLDELYNGFYFQASEDSELLNMSSLAPIYPMGVIDGDDSRAINTAQAFLRGNRGRLISHSNSAEAGFPWAAGVLATIFALQGDGETAWQIIETTRPTICMHGGMTEVMQDGQWNMQYFGTAQGAVCTAIHNMLLQSREDEIHVFPAIPPAWEHAKFHRLLAAGLHVSAEFDKTCNRVDCTLENNSPSELTCRVRFGNQGEIVNLKPEEARRIQFTGCCANR